MPAEFHLSVNDRFPGDVLPPDGKDLTGILLSYGIQGFGVVRLIDSTRGAGDIRLNYVIDKRYVLRFCSAPDMTEDRMARLNRLADRYLAAGILCPRFIPGPDGRYLHPFRGLQYYLSEYIDLPLADEVTLPEGSSLGTEVNESVARFAETYRDVDLMDTFGMYSLFDLSPFDRAEGMDEKEQNFNQLLSCLDGMGQNDIAARLRDRHTQVRSRLKAVYRGLPRCVFQADENMTNVLVDAEGHFRGLIDFNLAGTEVIINQLVNLAGFDYDEENTLPADAAHRLAYALDYHRRCMAPMLKIYRLNEQEKQAIGLYAWIVMISQWPTVRYFTACLNDPARRGETLSLLSLIADVPENAFL